MVELPDGTRLMQKGEILPAYCRRCDRYDPVDDGAEAQGEAPVTDQDQKELSVWMTGVILALTSLIRNTGRGDQEALLARLMELTQDILKRWAREDQAEENPDAQAH